MLAIERSYRLNPLVEYVKREKPAFRVGVNGLLPEKIGYRFDTRNTAEKKEHDCNWTTWVIAPDRTIAWRGSTIFSVAEFEKAKPEIRAALRSLGVKLSAGD